MFELAEDAASWTTLNEATYELELSPTTLDSAAITIKFGEKQKTVTVTVYH